jgi:hypothetical protein
MSPDSPFFFFLWCDNNRTRTGSWRTNWNCIAFELGIFLLAYSLFFVFSPLMRKRQNYFSDTEKSSVLEAEGLTPKLLRLQLYCIWTWGFFLLSSLYLSNACLAYHWLIHYLSLFISMTLFFCLFGWGFLFVCLFCFFPFFFTFFAFPLLSSFHSRYHHCYYYKLDNTKLHTVQGQ